MTEEGRGRREGGREGGREGVTDEERKGRSGNGREREGVR